MSLGELQLAAATDQIGNIQERTATRSTKRSGRFFKSNLSSNIIDDNAVKLEKQSRTSNLIQSQLMIVANQV